MEKNTIIANDTQARTTNNPGMEVTQLKNTLIEEIAKVSQCNMAATRKLNGYMFKDCIKQADIKQVPKIMRIDQINTQDIQAVIPAKGITVVDELKSTVQISAAQVLIKALSNNRLKHVLEAVVSINEKKRIQTLEIEKRGLDAQTPRSLDLIDEAKVAFNLDADDPIMTIEIDPNNHPNIDFEIMEVERLGSYRQCGVLVRQHGLDSKDAWRGSTPLGINEITIKEMKVHYPQWSCSKKAGGCGKMTGNAQRHEYGGCKHCEEGTSALVGQSPNIQLPFIKEGVVQGSTTGLIEYRVLRISKTLASRIELAQKGLLDVSVVINELCASDAKTKMRAQLPTNGVRTTQWPAAQINKAAFDCLAYTEPVFGLVVDYRKA